MSLIDLVELEPGRGLNLRHIVKWLDGDLVPVDGRSLPGVVRVAFPDGEIWDLTGAAADRFRAAIRSCTAIRGVNPPAGKPVTQHDPDGIGPPSPNFGRSG